MPGETDAEREKRELTVIFGGQFPFFGGRGVAEVEPTGGTAATGHGIVKEMQCCQNSNNALADRQTSAMLIVSKRDASRSVTQ